MIKKIEEKIKKAVNELSYEELIFVFSAPFILGAMFPQRAVREGKRIYFIPRRLDYAIVIPVVGKYYLCIRSNTLIEQFISKRGEFMTVNLIYHILFNVILVMFILKVIISILPMIY